MKKTKKVIGATYPCSVTVHWPSGPVNVCEPHAQALAGLGRMLGSHVALTKYSGDAECTNCVNEKAAESNARGEERAAHN